jgi:trimeric autotransporter adhesin
MSTKTNFKRVALVAVASLGLGVLTSVAPASAAVLSPNIITVAGGDNTANNMCANTTASNVDSAVIPVTASGFTIGAAVTVADDMTAYAKVSGPGVISSAGAAWTIASTTAAGSGDLTAVAASTLLTIKPTGVGTIKVTLLGTNSSTGTAVDVVTITVVEKCSKYTYSAALSNFAIVSNANALSGGTFATNIDADEATVASAGIGNIRMKLKDVYGGSLLSDALIATVSGDNCLVDLDATAGSAGGYGSNLSKSAVMAADGSDHVVSVYQYDSDVPATCVTTVTYAGTTIGTKTFTLRGIPAKVTVSDVTVGAVNGKGYYRTTVTDAAGNLLPSVAISASSTEANNAAALLSGVITAVQDNTDAATSATAGSGFGKTQAVTAANATTATSGALGLTRYACNASKGGTAKITVRAVVDAATATYVTSDPFAVACGGALATWSVSMDKATYAPGEIATLTLSGKDSNGFAVSTFTLLSGVVASFGGMTAVTAPTDNDAFSSGIGTKTYSYSVGTTEGAFVGTFKTTGSTDTAAKTVQYKITAPSTGAVSNADVLKAIVSLIASINKQIAALQKALLKR